MHDLIGDIHGHAGELEALLRGLGYARRGGVFRHPSRTAIFLGDFIDRGPNIRETLQIVRPMVETGAALAVMGNHEINALAYHTPDRDSPGEHLRRHTAANSNQHAETVRQLSAGDLASHLAWFRTLPLWLDLDGLRVVHACWDDVRMARIAGPVTDDFLHEACRPMGGLFEPVEAILKGKETPLPEGMTYRDKDGTVRTHARVKWYEPTSGHTLHTYLIETDIHGADGPLPQSVIEAAVPYPPDDKPVFTGHYWLKGPVPTLQRANVACLDWSVAKGGFLCAYQWDGERVLDEERFVRAP